VQALKFLIMQFSRMMTVNDALLRMWKEAALAYFRALFQHFPGSTVTYYDSF